MTTATARGKPASSAPPSAQRDQAQAQRQAYHRRKTRAKGQSDALRQKEAAHVEALPVQHAHAAGIDIGSRSHWVCVGFTTEAPSGLIQEFPAHTDGRKALAAFLREHQVNTVALESTGIYWIPLYELLQAEGFEVLLVDPSYSHQLRGRPKTDRRDCQWIYRLHSVGLLAAAFRPDEQTCRLRAYLRQRANLIRSASRHVQHMQKALEQMNLKLTEILSDITGVTGRSILRSILRGTRAPEKLAKYRDKQCKASEAQIAQALTGSYREEHLLPHQGATGGSAGPLGRHAPDTSEGGGSVLAASGGWLKRFRAKLRSENPGRKSVAMGLSGGKIVCAKSFALSPQT
jgi:hypothetical protein